MKKILFFLLFFARTASAQMAVIDTNGLAESIKQNATMAAILENGKAIWDTTKEGLEATKQITDTVGSAVSAKVHVPAGVRLAIGDYDVLTATQISLSGPVSLSLDASELTKASARLAYDSSRNAIVLRVYPRALQIIVR